MAAADIGVADADSWFFCCQLRDVIDIGVAAASDSQLHTEKVELAGILIQAGG